MKQVLKRISDIEWEIPKSFRSDMRVPARIYASESMLESIGQDRSLNQLVNVSTLPGIQKAALVMPDVHEGYGFPIGGVAATKFPDGAISPGGKGYDINCGVRLASTGLQKKDVGNRLNKLIQELFKTIPTGVGASNAIRKLNKTEMKRGIQTRVIMKD